MWFYVLNGQQQGPFTETQFNQMIAAGTIKLDTLVWKEGRANWDSLANVRRHLSPADACESCQSVVGADHLIELGGVRVCETCKPIVLQKLREGVPVSPANPRKRPVWVWIISLFYFVCTPLGVLSLIFVWWLGSSGLPMSGTQRHYFQSQTIFDHLLVLVATAINLYGAIQLFRLRAQAFALFVANLVLTFFNFGYQIAFKNWLSVMASQPGGYLVTGFTLAFTFGFQIAILWYIWHLKNERVLR